MTWPTIIGGVDTPKRLYHGTDRSSIRSILALGLAPRRPRDQPWGKYFMSPGDWNDVADVLEPEKAVYLTPYFPVAALGKERVIVIKAKGLELILPDTPCTVCALDRIPARRIVQVRDRDGTVTWKRA